MNAGMLALDRRLFFVPLRFRIVVVAAVVSFLIYACTVLLVRVEQENDFQPERSSIAAAVSNVAYGAPLGKVYSGVLDHILDFNVPLENTLAQASRRQLPAGALVGSTSDGNGIGYIVVASLSMRVFGLHTLSLILGMLALMAISTTAFLCRYPDRRAIVVVLYFAVLTVMLFTPLVTYRPYAVNLGIGGIRYFSFLAILPGYHLFLEFPDPRALNRKFSGWSLVVAAMQVVVLLLAILVRNSAAPVIASILAGAGVFAWLRRRVPLGTWRVLQKAGYMGVVAIAFVGVLMLTASTDYLKDGRFTETVWHRIFLGLHVNPAWPYGNVRDLFDCKHYIPEGIVSGADDRNAHCVWWDYVAKHHIPVEVAVTKTYSREYDVALREATFTILWLYPKEALLTFFYYKPCYIVWSIAESLRFKLAGVQPALVWLFIAALGNVLLVALTAPTRPVRGGNGLIAAATVVFALSSIFPYIAVWAMPHTSGDLFFYCLFGVGLAGVTAIGWLRSALLESWAPPYRSVSLQG